MGELGFKSWVCENHFISYSCIFLILQCFEERLLQILLIFQNSFFLQFRSIKSVFRSIEIAFKNFSEPLPGSIDRTYFWINRTSWIKFFFFFFKSVLTDSIHFFKSFSNFSLSLRLGKAPLKIFCRFSTKFLQGFSLTRPVIPLYPSFCFYFYDCMHKLMHFKGFSELFKFGIFVESILFFLKLINGFCFYIDIFMIYVG